MYKKYYELYKKNRVTVESLQKLATANKLTQAEVDRMVKDRREEYGY